MANTINYQNYTITREDNGSMSVSKDGQLQPNAKVALKEVAQIIGFERAAGCEQSRG